MQYASAILRVISKQFIHAHSNTCSHIFRTFVQQFAHLQTSSCILTVKFTHICTVTLSSCMSTCLTVFFIWMMQLPIWCCGHNSMFVWTASSHLWQTALAMCFYPLAAHFLCVTSSDHQTLINQPETPGHPLTSSRVVIVTDI